MRRILIAIIAAAQVLDVTDACAREENSPGFQEAFATKTGFRIVFGPPYQQAAGHSTGNGNGRPSTETYWVQRGGLYGSMKALGSSASVMQKKAKTSKGAVSMSSSVNFAVWRVDHQFQSHYGPAGKGYKATGYYPDDAMPDAQSTWRAINSAGYTAKWMSVRRDWLATPNVHWGKVDSEISFGVRNKADYISIDDPLSPYSYGGALISDSTMLAFCHRVHLQGKKVAAADNDNIQGLLGSHPHFFDSIDVFMPYGYNRSLAELQSYFTWVRTHFPGKAIVPILGYHVWDVNPPHKILKDQLGAQSGHAAFIEMAQQCAAANADPKTRIVFYYYEPDSPWPETFDAKGGLKTYLDSLTSYLLRYKYLPSPP